MSLDSTVPEFIKDQEAKTLSIEDVTAKFEDEQASITIREVGLYHHPTIMFRDGDTKRLNRHLKMGGSTEDFEYLGTFEYESIHYPTTPAEISLIGFALDEDTEYTIEEYDTWMSQNSVPEPTFEEFKDWCSDEENDALRELYTEESEAIWHLSQSPSYEKGIITPLLSVAVVFEDAAGVSYTGIFPVDLFEEETKRLLEITLEEQTVEIEETEEPEDNEETEDTDDAEEVDDTETEETETRVEYTTVDTEAVMNGHAVQLEDFTFEFEVIVPPDWYSTPFLTHAFDAVSETSYELIQSLEDGWYTVTAEVDTDTVHSRNQIFLSLPYETIPIPWNPSLDETHITRRLLSSREEDVDEIEVRVRSPYTASEENVGNSYAVGRNYVWVVAPVETDTTDIDTENQIPPEEPVESSDTQDTSNTGSTTQQSVNDKPNGILERLGLR